MNNRHLQMLLAATKLYSGGIDGVIGSKTLAALHAAEQKYKDWYEFDPSGSAMFRREIACAQACLKELGHEPGKVDGWNGLNTTEAMNAFLYKTANGKDEVIDRTPTPAALAKPAPSSIPHQSEVGRVYGTPGPQIEPAFPK